MSARRRTPKLEKVELQMTSMIDVVFLLLAFFVITYKTPDVEGDFAIR
ncbi:MAG: biopolymer transporter ExbD, partial [Thermoguttaceae bacterium]|nr:biopolymer transporter ExbD [Thermoguttaceae bacterium]